MVGDVLQWPMMGGTHLEVLLFLLDGEMDFRSGWF